MLRVRSGRGGTEEEPSEDYILEGEYEKLKRSYRVMQNDYHRYKEDCQHMLKKQKYVMSDTWQLTFVSLQKSVFVD